MVLEGQLVAVFDGVMGQRVPAPLMMNGLVEDAGSWMGRSNGAGDGGGGRAWLLAQCVRSRQAREGYVEAYLKFTTPRGGRGGGGGGEAGAASKAPARGAGGVGKAGAGGSEDRTAPKRRGRMKASDAEGGDG